MCLPALPALATHAANYMAATAVAVQTVGMKQQADAQYAYQEEAVRSNKTVAMQQMSDIRTREANENEALSRKQWEASIEGRRARSKAVVAAGDSGASGNSVEVLLSDFAMQEGRYKNAITRQKELNAAGADLNVSSIQTGNAAENKRIGRPVGQPNYLAAALRIGSELYA